MAVISGIFKKIAEKISNPTESSMILTQALNADPTRTASEVRKAQAAGMSGSAAASLLLQGLDEETKAVGRMLTRMGIPLAISSAFESAAGKPSTSVSVQYNGQNLLSFKASPSESGYYLQMEENTGGGGFSLAMMQNKPVASFDEVESELVKSLDSVFNIPKEQAAPALKNMIRCV